MNDNENEFQDRKTNRRENLSKKSKSHHDNDIYLNKAHKSIKRAFKQQKERMIEEESDEDMENYRF